MFDGICILLALFLFYKAEEGYRDIAFFVLCWFIVSDVAYHYFFLDIRYAPGNGWIIFGLIYNAINVAIIVKLWLLSSPLLIRRILVVNVLLNIVASYYFISNSVADLVYTMYEYPAGFLMILCLYFLWMVSYGVRYCNNKANHTGVVCSILRHCLRSRRGTWLDARIHSSRSE